MNVAQLQKVQEKIAAQGGEHLGTLLWWSLNNNHIHYGHLVGLAQKHGLNTNYLPSPIKPVNAFRRACRSAGRRLGEGLMLRQIADTDDSIVVGLVKEDADKICLDLNYTTLAKITFNKATKSLNSDSSHAVVQRVSELYRHHLAHTTQDIMLMMLSFVRESGVSLRQRGGTYFIPAERQPSLDALTEVVREAGDNIVYQLPLYDAAQVRDTLTTVARDSLDEEIRALKEELEGFDEKTRQSTLVKRMDKFDELRSRVSLFSGVLSFKADDFNAKISNLHRELRVKLGLDAGDTQEIPPVTPVSSEDREIAESSWKPDKTIGF